MTVAFAPVLWAAAACPLMLVDGHADREGIGLSFRNKAKVPVEEVELTCKPVSGTGTGAGLRPEICHAERGIFYPGGTYDIHFSYPQKKAGPVVVAVRTARMAGGAEWMARRDETCKSLKVGAKPS